MIHKSILIVLLILIAIISLKCVSAEGEHTAIFKSNSVLPMGEWIRETDSLSGLTIIGNRMGFFKDMKIAVEDVHSYVLVDSISASQNDSVKLGEYLFFLRESDTLKYKIVKRDNSVIVLSQGDKEEKYIFWR